MGKSDYNSVNNTERNVVLVNYEPHHHGLVKANRFLLALVSALMSVVILLGLFLFSGNNVLDQVATQQRQSQSMSVQNPALSDEINILKSQLVGLISGSIESKLRVLEESIKIGSTQASLGTIEDLRGDVKLLRGYSQPPAKQGDQQLNQQLVEEITNLKKLIYLVFASCGLMIAAIASFWLRRHYRLPKRTIHSFLHHK